MPESLNISANTNQVDSSSTVNNSEQNTIGENNVGVVNHSSASAGEVGNGSTPSTNVTEMEGPTGSNSILTSTGPVEQHEKLNPASKSEGDTETRKLAMQQTKAARAILYNPSETVKNELSGAASNLKEMYDNLNTKMKETLGSRLLGEQGLMKGKSIDDLGNVLANVANKEGSANDRASVIALMGDIGALFADTGATTGMETRDDKAAADLRDIIRDNVPALTDEVVNEMKQLGDSKVVGPNKSNERARPSNSLVERAGIHNTGNQVDQDLQASQNLNADNFIHAASWQEATISKEKLDNTTEPMVGHMSGSPSEILMVWDALQGEQDMPFVAANNKTKSEAEDKDYVQKRAFHDIQSGERKGARLAATTAMLVGIGFHSSVENIESALKYTGQNPRPVAIEGNSDATNFLGEGAATSLLKELHEDYTA